MASASSSHSPVPSVDIWTFFFEQIKKPFPDEQKIYTCPTTQCYHTYGDVRADAIRVGSALITQLSWKKGDVLSILSPNCIDMPAVIWGCHWAGGVVLPSNPTSSAEELAQNLKDSGTKIMVVHESLLAKAIKAAEIAKFSTSNIFIIGERRDNLSPVRHLKELMTLSGRARRVESVPEDIAYLVYSSGTTGLPKGVMLSHGNIVASQIMCHTVEGKMLNWRVDKTLSVLPFYHIYGLVCLVHQPMFLGVESIVMPQFDLEAFCSIIQQFRITYSYVAPPIVRHLAKSLVVTSYDLSSLRMLTCGAAPLSKDLILAVHARLGLTVKQAYGLSETTSITHCQTWNTWKTTIGSVGRPLPLQEVKFVDSAGQQVPRGRPGELWIKGPNVFKGYYKAPKATMDSISSDGFFMTGDIGFEDMNGNLYITDRVKELIKYKGYQVAPAESEGILINHPFVNDVAVVGIYVDHMATEIPMAFVVPANHATKDEATAVAIIKWLSDRTANAKKLRGGVVWVDQISKSASGKILRRTLKRLVEGKDALVPMGAIRHTKWSHL